VGRLRVPTSHVERSSSTGRAAPRGTWRSATRSSDFTIVPRGTSLPPQGVGSTWNTASPQEIGSTWNTRQGCSRALLAEAHRAQHPTGPSGRRQPSPLPRRLVHRGPTAPLSPRCFERSGGCQRGNTFRETAAQSGRMTPQLWAGRGMANQRATARWPQVMRVDQSRGGGMAMVAWLAGHDPRSRLRACRTFFRA
jgi:hypothetical protein